MDSEDQTVKPEINEQAAAAAETQSPQREVRMNVNSKAADQTSKRYIGSYVCRGIKMQFLIYEEFNVLLLSLFNI